MPAPEFYSAPFGGWTATAVVAVEFLALVTLLVFSPLKTRQTRPYLRIVSATLSLLALTVLVVFYLQIWSGSGSLWNALASQGSGPIERLVENLLLWIPVLMLGVSVLLASLSGESRGRLVPVAVIGAPTLALCLYATAVMGLSISPS